jgi:membrane-associated protein
MESIISFACLYAHEAHWMIFCLLLLAGFNVPISEDLLLIMGGIISGSCIPDHTLHLYAWLFAGCWLSAWISYWIGRIYGPKLYDIKWFSHILTRKRIEKLHYYYEKFGIFTFIVGRFLPGGVRNALFMSSGLGKMPFKSFILRDGFACLISSATLFSLGLLFAQNYQVILHYFKGYEEIVLTALGLLVMTGLGLYLWKQWKTNKC